MKKHVTFLCLGLFVTSLGISHAASKVKKAEPKTPQTEEATFAGGCFWCMQPPFDKLKGVISTRAGYMGGSTKNPTYEENSSGTTGHAESVEVTFDPSQINYSQLLDVFWRNTNPTQANGQFVDIGSQYRSAIFYHNEEQKRLAIASKKQLEKSGVFGAPLVTEINPASTFYPAEEYHQKYYLKNPIRYKFYRYHSGRDQYLHRIWGDTVSH